MNVGMKALGLSVLFASSFAFAGGPEATVDVTLSPAGDFQAKTADVKGEAWVDGDRVEAQNVVVSLKNLKTGIDLRDKHTRDKYLEVAKFPDAVVTKAVGKNGKGKAKIKIRGVEKEVAGTYKVEGKFLHATFPVTLSNHGIKDVKYMGVGVDDEVKINVVIPIKEGRMPASK